MTLAAGSRLGPYEILSPLGAGGMGEVYRARDTRLSRDVAVKVLPSHVSPTPEARQRFEREARTVSQLSHPNVCALYDVGREGETEYLVMELLEGETLSDRLAKGAMPLEQALRFGAEIAAALAAAHQKGIVHRDLKPGNIMVTRSGVKLLDFGLARAFETPVAAVDLTVAPTVAKDLTADGVVVGTVAYMAPEQLEGKEVDARTDIFALGVVLYEMAAGRKAFSGSSPATLISAILTSEPPPVSASQPVSPPELDRLVHTCLSRDPADRWQSAHDVELQLRAIAGNRSGARPATATGAVPAQRPRRAAWPPWAVAAALGVIAAVALVRGSAPKAAPAAAVRFSVMPPENGEFGYAAEGNFLGISPDGLQIAYVASDPKGGRRVWVRPVSALEARPIPGTEGASSIMWSPDGRSIGFFTSDKLKRVDLGGGAAVPICDIEPGGGGKAGTWGRGDIVFTNIQGGAMYRVSASGGQPAVVMRIDRSRNEMRFAWPWFLPDGERFLYALRYRSAWGSLMLAEPGKAPRVVMPIASFFQYADPGYLVFSREGTLVAQRFDWKAARVSGEPISIAERVRYFYSTASAAFAARAGTIVYQSRGDASRLVWIDRAGKEVGTVGPSGGYLNVVITRDGRRVFFDRTRPGPETYHLWSYDLDRGVESSVPSSVPDTEAMPMPLPDGRSLVYSTVRGAPPQLMRRDLDTGKEAPLTEESRAFQVAQDVSPDGRTLLYTERGDAGNFDVWTLPLSGPGKPTPLFQSPFGKAGVRFSPDGRFIAFITSESGSPEAYVMPYPGPGEKVRVSNGGAWLLRWSRSGELYYLSGGGRFISVPVRTAPSLQIGSPTTLFTLAGKPWIDFDLTPDAKRILAIVPEVVGDESPLNVIVNWPAEVPK